MSLSDLTGSIPGFLDRWSHTERIKLFAWYLHAQKGVRRWATGDLRRCYDEAGMKAPSSFAPWFQTLEAQKVLHKDLDGYFIERRVIEDFARRYAGATRAPRPTQSLRALTERIADPAERSLVEEAIRCIAADAQRAAVVLGWCAVIDRIRRKIQHEGFASFNAASVRMKNSTGKYKWWKKGVQASCPGDLLAVFDTDLIVVLVGMDLLDANQARRLEVLFGWRCDSAHPSSAPIGEAHLEAFFRDAIDLVLANPKFAV